VSPEAEDAPAPRRIDDLNTLIEVLDLQTVKFYELYALADDEAEPATDDPPISVRTALRKRPAGIDYRVEFEVRRPNGTIRADAAAVYSAEAPIDATDEVLLDFGDMVAMMTVVPYLRQAISDLAQRLGDHVVVPMLPRGALSFRPTVNPADDDEAVDGATHESDSQQAVDDAPEDPSGVSPSAGVVAMHEEGETHEQG
jgi:hypothetical protein